MDKAQTSKTIQNHRTSRVLENDVPGIRSSSVTATSFQSLFSWISLLDSGVTEYRCFYI
jgi:hypothetical protein